MGDRHSRGTTSLATVVGVSYIDLVEARDDDYEERLEDAAGEVGLSLWWQTPRLDNVTDVYIGVEFRDRPTDAQVAAATEKVKAALPKLTELLGPASSDVEVWNGVMVG